MRTRVKICGITRPEDGLDAVRLGADAIGLVFYGPSPRNVTIEQAQVIAQALPPFVTKVALVVDADQAQIEQILDAVSVDILQFHGNEPPEACSCYNRPYIKALRVRDDTDITGVVSTYAEAGASAILLDAYQPGIPGGTGTTFDWSCIPQGLSLPVILAGGLTPENVAQAVEQVHPYAVDVSGGVESEPGIKDAQKIASFIKEATGSS